MRFAFANRSLEDLYEKVARIPMCASRSSFGKTVCPARGGGGGTPYNGLYGEAAPERGTFFTLQVYKRVGISRVEVYARVGKSVI